MSRNLGRVSCYFCPGTPVLAGDAMPFAQYKARSSFCFPEYASLIVAPATCPLCEAKYVAWCSSRDDVGQWKNERGFFDLSFWSTFNDEPGPEDLPKWKIETAHRRVGPYR